jgi:hypothetical protein
MHRFFKRDKHFFACIEGRERSGVEQVMVVVRGMRGACDHLKLIECLKLRLRWLMVYLKSDKVAQGGRPDALSAQLKGVGATRERRGVERETC